jgi:hypothetical protein
VPFLFLTAYSLDSIPVEHRARPFFRKPHTPEGLLAALVRLLPPAADGERRQAANDETNHAKPKPA